ncbi:MAG: NIPSNAP family protein [Acidimicrobiia bacterium]|nr:NIPSNAP family protein [Acidimicrobiia bacterium]
MKLVATIVLMIGMATMANAEVYELRTYTALPGRLDALNKRFREHTAKLFEKHGMKNIGYWVPQDEPRKANTLIYVVSHKSREAAAKNWEAFRNDPEWVKARTESEKDGKIVDKVESVFMDAVDYSPLK